MDDLEQKLSALLQDPAALERVGSLFRSLDTSADPAAATPPEPAPEPAAPDLSALSGLLGQLGSAAAPGAESPPAADLLSRLGPLLTASAGKDPDTALLQALRPYLHGDREKRLNDALHVMRLKELLPLLNRS